jgi:hypothetical protein
MATSKAAAALLLASWAGLLVAMHGEAADAPADQLRLRLVEIVDATGFGQPMVAATVLLPSDWQVESGVRWTPYPGCVQNVVQLSLVASSPDGRLGGNWRALVRE